MFELNGMTEMTEMDAREVTGGIIIVVCIVKSDLGGATNDAAKVSMQDFHFVM